MTLAETIPVGIAVIARCRSWNPARFVEILIPLGGKMVIKNPFTGEKTELATESTIAADWEICE